ncbi:helix-turn-helix transcriptional regulator [Bacillus sp. T3]|uniref:helix-turn-helix domain-containing protein n=1 Tax=Bacillus sp. T3 TaxID=467262 RepID=UPI002980A56F|nr:helix-turn-helix transcriptional regulator [Bacillus sp. T3]
MLQRLAQLRKNKNWSLQETADQLGIAKSTYAGYESGYREPPIKALTQMADLFETSVDYLLNRVEDKNTNLELTELLTSNNVLVTLDEIALTKEEFIDFIAFTRVKRGLK